VPVSFAEINTVSVLCEIDTMHEGLVPDLSLGTHFFNDLVELDILYIGFFSTRKENILNKDFFSQSPNRLEEHLPDASTLSGIVRVIEASNRQRFVLSTDMIKQNAVVHIDRNQTPI
jgi:hypothetical protein